VVGETKFLEKELNPGQPLAGANQPSKIQIFSANLSRIRVCTVHIARDRE
jgi:hypothetical protein